MNPTLLTIILILPATTAFVDCRTACRTCREAKTEPRTLEVHCAMCDECKQRRRERMQKRLHLVQSEPVQLQYLGGIDQESQHVVQEYKPRRRPRRLRRPSLPPGCPTPPLCSDSGEDEEDIVHMPQQLTLTITSTTTTTTTTTTAKPTCPPTPKCLKKRRKPKSALQMPHYRQALIYPQVPFVQQSCCMPIQPCGGVCPWPGKQETQQHQVVHLSLTQETTTKAQTQGSSTKKKNKEFLELYVGIPKQLLRRG